jgi:hypothetical protein
MNKVISKEACQLAIDLIEEQLEVLSISIALILQSANADDIQTVPGATPIPLPRKRGPLKAGSAAASAAPADFTFEFHVPDRVLRGNALRKMNCVRVLIGNALLAIDSFLKEHNIAASRNPQIQFLGHISSAIVNANTFRIDPGYIPGASFDGLEIDSGLDGALLFGDGITEGFMESGDAVALIQWLAQHLHETLHLVSGGDAG